MKRYFMIAAFLIMSTAAQAQQSTAVATAQPATNTPICLIEGVPSADQYKIIKKVKVAKGIYGGFEEIKPKLANLVRERGADVVIDYHQSQRFGFWPWRVVRPVLWGTAVKWNTPVNCSALGGKEIY